MRRSHTNLHSGPIWNYNQTVEKLSTMNNWAIAKKNLHNLRQKNQLWHNLSTPTQQHTRCGGQSNPQSTSCREGPTKKTQQSKPKYIQRANINDIPRAASSGDQLHHRISHVYYHRNWHHKHRESEQINLRSRGLQEEKWEHKQWEDKQWDDK